MFSGDLSSQLKSIFDDVSLRAADFGGMFESVQKFILDTFGQNGLYAFYIATAALLLFAATKIAKLAFSAMKYLVVPSVALAFAGSFVVPYSFLALLPVSVTVCSMVLLFKG